MATAKQIPGRRLGQRSRRRSPPQQGRPQAPAAAFQPSSPQPCSLSTHFAERQSTLRTFSLKRQGPQRCRLSTDPPEAEASGLRGVRPPLRFAARTAKRQEMRPRAKFKTPHEWGEARGREKRGRRALPRTQRPGARSWGEPSIRPLFTVLSRILGLGSETFKGKERIRGNLGPA